MPLLFIVFHCSCLCTINEVLVWDLWAVCTGGKEWTQALQHLCLKAELCLLRYWLENLLLLPPLQPSSWTLVPSFPQPIPPPLVSLVPPAPTEAMWRQLDSDALYTRYTHLWTHGWLAFLFLSSYTSMAYCQSGEVIPNQSASLPPM